MRRLLIPLVALLAVAAASAGAQTTPVSQILSVRLDGSDPRSLSGAEPAAAVAVAPRDGRIFFARAGSGGEAAYWVMNADGSEQRQLGAGPADGYYGPAWSPDGGTIGLTRWDESPCTPSSRNCAISAWNVCFSVVVDIGPANLQTPLASDQASGIVRANFSVGARPFAAPRRNRLRSIRWTPPSDPLIQQ